LFKEARVVKAERDDLRILVPTLKADQECAKITRGLIGAEWVRFIEQFIHSTNFNEWI